MPSPQLMLVKLRRGSPSIGQGSDLLSLAAGSDGQFLVADSTQAGGLRWADTGVAPGGGAMVVQNVTLDPVNWTLITGPANVPVSTVLVRHAVADANGNPITPQDIFLRTDQNDGSTQIVIAAGYQDTFKFSGSAVRGNLFYLRAKSGTGPAEVVFLG
jgi:hypothetical protein